MSPKGLDSTQVLDRIQEMGFSPGGELVDTKGNKYHLEKKDGPRIVLWDEHESRVVLELTMESWDKLREQLDWLPGV